MRLLLVIIECVWDERTAYTRGNSRRGLDILVFQKRKENKRKEMQSVKVLFLIKFCNVLGHLIRETLFEKSVILHTFIFYFYFINFKIFIMALKKKHAFRICDEASWSLNFKK